MQKSIKMLTDRQKINNGSGEAIITPSPMHKPNPGIGKRKAATAVERPFRSLKKWIIAYQGALVITGVIVPIMASITMAGIRLANLDMFNLNAQWFPFISSTIITGVIWLLAALCNSFFTSAQTANSHSYGLLVNRLCQLKANLELEGDIDDITDLEQQSKHIKNKIEEARIVKFNNAENTSASYHLTALNEAYICYIDVCKMLQDSPSGLLWTSGAGYINAWRLLHHAEEALIETMPIEEVIRGAIHDKLAIQGSTLSHKDELLDKLLQAAVTLQPKAEIYFKEHQPNKGDMELNQLTEALKHKLLQELIDKNELSSMNNPENPHEARVLARVALREVRSTLNDFRDKSWEGIMRARNRLLESIAVTGIVTHILLSMAILTSNTVDAITAATAFYLIGAVTGLFGRFYRESVAGTAVDDFGFSTARLVATPLLSGLAGIGGVMLTVMLASLGNTIGNTGNITMNDIFHMDPRLFVAAAIFGLAPNLLIKGLQDKASKYETDIQSSKAAEPDAASARE